MQKLNFLMNSIGDHFPVFSKHSWWVYDIHIKLQEDSVLEYSLYFPFLHKAVVTQISLGMLQTLFIYLKHHEVTNSFQKTNMYN